MLEAILIFIIYAHVGEYLLHRSAMHKPGLGKGFWFTLHIEHHRGRDDLNIKLPTWLVCLAASPMLLPVVWVGWQWTVVWFVCCSVYSVVWTALHSAHHNISYAWIAGIPGYEYWERHHLKHHERPNRNFGTVFPWTDYIFRTKI